MERTMLIMIAIVAIVAIGGLLYIGVNQAPEVIPVFIEGPSMQKAQGQSASTEPGQIKFSVAPISDSASGQIKFSMK